MGWLISMASGILMSMQGIFNTRVQEETGVWVSAVWAQVTAFLICLVCWGAVDRGDFLVLRDVTPRYVLLGGVLGAGITVTVIFGMRLVGPAQATVCIVVAQMIFSWLAERFGWFGVEKMPFSWMQFLGILLAAGGLVLIRMSGQGH